MVLLDTIFMNFSLLSTGSTLFWFAILLGLIIWKNTQDVFKTIVVMMILVPIFLQDAIDVNGELMILALVLLFLYLIERFLIK